MERLGSGTRFWMSDQIDSVDDECR